MLKHIDCLVHQLRCSYVNINFLVSQIIGVKSRSEITSWCCVAYLVLSKKLGTGNLTQLVLLNSTVETGLVLLSTDAETRSITLPDCFTEAARAIVTSFWTR